MSAGKITVIGEHRVSSDRLAWMFRDTSIRTTSSSSWMPAGSFHLLMSLDGTVRVRGTISGVRRVFHARVGGLTIASDRADVLAALAGGGIDEERLAVRLLSPIAPWPLVWRPLWRGVEAVLPGHDLELDGYGDCWQVRYWTPPLPTLSLQEGARALRSALTEAVDVRVRDDPVVASDLSGLDSTSLCCLAARTVVRLVAVTAASPDVMDDDVRWARLTAAALRTMLDTAKHDVVHDVISANDIPLTYHGILDADDHLDEPCHIITDRSCFLRLVEHGAAHGARVRLAGVGGDEVLDTGMAWLHSVSRTNPTAAIGLVRGFAAKYRWPRRRLVTKLLDNRSYRRWLAGLPRDIAAPVDLDDPPLDWGTVPSLPPWATREAARVVRDALFDAARTADPLANSRGMHSTLDTIHVGSLVARQFQQMAARHQVTLALPYLDDAVVNASLAVRPEQRLTPRRYKPLIVEAMRGIVPAETLARTTKSETGAIVEQGLREHRDQILDIAEGSLLAERGLVDADRMRQMCLRPPRSDMSHTTLESTIACEMWLRTVTSRTAPT
ncbi:asparagine synthase (glutamine-hydrolyzing) [Kibdelosporangium banguiense]|uniref:asparagine synthase (glutamine-hydrolyzing) n=1 Tax=Kibdelosporangium banguiense TaxID=1365924 RepID=A0ABS4TZZ2_9PSEU|nr:asparagine synthase-related protein [Kibdelosporangium banguiense]MBP2329558.1 asparagine synthase (glutamine-hydrolyzing) [Kibdelosporangium banguiense]